MEKNWNIKIIPCSEGDDELISDLFPGLQSVETRDCLIMDTEHGLVAILPVGMSQVGSCNWEESVKPGAVVRIGDPMGYFLFGGSDIVMIFQEGITLRLLMNEHILMGEPYASID